MQETRKNKIGWYLLTALLFMSSVSVWSQNASDLEINEVLVLNDSLNVDDYGQHSSWIEIFNKGYNTVDIGGCYLSDEQSNPTKYWIPTGDPSTKIPPRCYLIFWADGHASRGISHLNFNLRDATYVSLYESSGNAVIDQLVIDTPQVANRSFGRINESSDEWIILEKITPGSTNDHSRKISAGDKFVEVDPTGVGMTVVAMMVVFSSLALLYLIFKTTGNYFMGRARKAKKAALDQDRSVQGKTDQGDLSGEVSAAIAMALHLYQSELHDEENTVLTIKKVSRTYSPWSSKIHTLRKNPR
ncbi:MAG: OadG family transporter subunit [Prolixibacteraceae bacterium]